MKKAELLAPAGNLKKLKLAFYFGADAVYLGGKPFSLRAFADNFSREEMEEGISFAHARGKKVYVAVNIYMRGEDFLHLPEYLSDLQALKADGILVSDAGAFSLAKQYAPKVPVHISTQANTTNGYAAKFWQEAGASRVVLARELSLAEISKIHEMNPSLELEAFVHGAMCISYSGRCLLSDYLDGRPSNRGACVQACRRKYQVRSKEAKNQDFIDVEEDGRGTYLFNSKDLNMSGHLSELMEAGVCSLKIEGRMKSEYYLATVVNAYRRLLDGKDAAGELECCAHRDYTTAYAFGENSQTVSYDDSQTQGTCEYIANVVKSENGRVYAEMRNRFFAGDELEILSPKQSFGKKVKVTDLRAADGSPVEDAKRVQEIYSFPCNEPLSEGDILRRRRK